MDAPSPARVLTALEEIAIGVMKKVITLPEGADSISRWLRVMRGHASLGKAPGPFERHSSSSSGAVTCPTVSRRGKRDQRSSGSGDPGDDGVVPDAGLEHGDEALFE